MQLRSTLVQDLFRSEIVNYVSGTLLKIELIVFMNSSYATFIWGAVNVNNIHLRNHFQIN